MNCPAKTEPIPPDGHNQSPNDLSSDLTTNSDLGKLANARVLRGHRLSADEPPDPNIIARPLVTETDGAQDASGDSTFSREQREKREMNSCSDAASCAEARRKSTHFWRSWPRNIWRVLRTYCKFVGPGFMISVAYIDPGNYATDVAGGASYRFKLLFVVLLSNIFAIFLQSLCIHLGTVTGMNLAQMTRAHCPRWLNYTSYFFGESAIIATDMAEVIGTAMALYMLSNGKIPLVAGCALSIVDVLFILFFYRQNGASLSARRTFEFFVALLVLGVVVCFCIQLSYIKGATPGEVFLGYVPSSTLVEGKALYQACGILGATVMPHSLYLGSGIVQDRLKDFDREHNLLPATPSNDEDDSLKEDLYRPSIQAIRSCQWYATAECGISLFTFALFVNSAILIVAGASLYHVGDAASASLFGIYDLLSRSLAPAAANVFAIALLLSGTSAGIICTIAGQMVSEGQLNLKIKPWKRRLLTRSISITPSIIVAGALGGPGVGKALVGSQVALSIILPFVSAPLVWFTCRSKYMQVTDNVSSVQQGVGVGQDDEAPRSINMRVHWVTAVFAVLVWGFIVIMNVALLVLLGTGAA